MQLSQLQSVCHLILTCCPKLPTSSLDFLSQLPQLEFLEITECIDVTLDEVLLSTLANCPNLEILECDLEPATEYFRMDFTEQEWENIQRLEFHTLSSEILHLRRFRHDKQKYQLCGITRHAVSPLAAIQLMELADHTVASSDAAAAAPAAAVVTVAAAHSSTPAAATSSTSSDASAAAAASHSSIPADAAAAAPTSMELC